MEIKEKLFQLQSKQAYSVITEALSNYLDNHYSRDEEDLDYKEAKDLLSQLKTIDFGSRNNQITTLFAEEKINDNEYIQIIFRVVNKDDLKSKELDKYFNYK